jgi:hemolysin D
MRSMGETLQRRPTPSREPLNLVALEFVSPAAAIIARPAPPMARRIVWIMSSLFFSILGLMAWLPVERVVVARGRLIATTPTILMQPLETSIVRSFMVRANQVVRAGDLIARLDPTFTGADLASLQNQFESLQAEVQRLEAEASGQVYAGIATPQAALQAAIFGQRQAERAFRLENYSQRMNSLDEIRQRSEAELRQLRDRQAISGQIETMRRELERVQVGSRLQSLLAADARLEIQGSMASAEGTSRGAQRDQRAVAAEREAYITNYQAQVSQDLAERRRALSEVRENLAKAQLRSSLVEMRAPVDAVVFEVGKSSVGAVLAPGELLVSLVPVNAELLIDGEVGAQDLGFVAVGDRVAIKFDSFPYVRHGIAHGTVLTLSEDAIRQDPDTRQPLRSPYFRTRIAINEMVLRNLPAEFRLIPGMPVTADIVVGRRTPLSYLFERIAPSLMEGMREP